MPVSFTLIKNSNNTYFYETTGNLSSLFNNYINFSIDTNLFEKINYDILFLNNGHYYRPSSYIESPMTSDVFDYIHFAFCYFFLTAFLLLLWLVFTLDLLSYRSENVEPIIETRGFSRAQTGDLFTAIIPLTWSLSMIIHAGSHSSNFDENTDNCLVELNVIAYQWGWNYYLPSDILNTSNDFSYNSYFFSKKNNISTIKVYEDINFFNIMGNDVAYNYNEIFYINNSSSGVRLNLFKTDFIDSIVNIVKLNYSHIYKFNNIYTPSLLLDFDQEYKKFNDMFILNSSRNIYYDNINIKVSYSKNTNYNVIDHRLVINNGLVLPIDTPIHIICGSKDVIHSWAIPGLLIKIDCIPGYNCHRRLFIKWVGIYWGQCMEVCGRYHHWMPILVRTTYYEIFLMWLASVSAELRIK